MAQDNEPQNTPCQERQEISRICLVKLDKLHTLGLTMWAYRKGPPLALRAISREVAWGHEIGEKLKAAREFADITQRELERRSGVSRATIQNYEAGRVADDPPVRILVALAIGLGIEPFQLMPDDYLGRTALVIIQRMEKERGKELARLRDISRRSTPGRSTASSKKASGKAQKPRKGSAPIILARLTCVALRASGEPSETFQRAA